MRQLIHQNQRRTAGEGGVEIELIDVPPAMGKPPRRQSAQALQHRGGLFTAVGLRHANQNIQPWARSRCASASIAQSFPHPGAGAKEHFQFAAMRGGGVLQQAVRVRRSGSSLIYLSFRASSAILSCSILTTGWPRKLSSGVCVA